MVDVDIVLRSRKLAGWSHDLGMTIRSVARPLAHCRITFSRAPSRTDGHANAHHLPVFGSDLIEILPFSRGFQRKNSNQKSRPRAKMKTISEPVRKRVNHLAHRAQVRFALPIASPSNPTPIG